MHCSPNRIDIPSHLQYTRHERTWAGAMREKIIISMHVLFGFLASMLLSSQVLNIFPCSLSHPLYPCWPPSHVVFFFFFFPYYALSTHTHTPKNILTPFQRMKRIAKEWAFSEKNPHKTRRKSRFLNPDGASIGTWQDSTMGASAPEGSFSSASGVPQDQVSSSPCSSSSSSKIRSLKSKAKKDDRVEE